MRFQRLRPGVVLFLSQRASSEWGALAQEEGDVPEEDEYFQAASQVSEAGVGNWPLEAHWGALPFQVFLMAQVAA